MVRDPGIWDPGLPLGDVSERNTSRPAPYPGTPPDCVLRLERLGLDRKTGLLPALRCGSSGCSRKNCRFFLLFRILPEPQCRFSCFPPCIFCSCCFSTGQKKRNRSVPSQLRAKIHFELAAPMRFLLLRHSSRFPYKAYNVRSPFVTTGIHQDICPYFITHQTPPLHNIRGHSG